MAIDLQAAINATPAGGTLSLVAGQSYGPGKVSRLIHIRGNGVTIAGSGNVVEFAPGSDGSTLRNVTVQGPVSPNAACILVRAPSIQIEDVLCQDSLQYGIRIYATANCMLTRVTIKRAATGIQVHRGTSGHTFDTIRCEQLDRMRVDDGSAGTNGAQGIDFYNSGGTTTIRNLTVIGARAKTKGGVSWPYDGSAVEGYGGCGPVIVDGFIIRDCVNICEVGTTSGGPVPTGWTFKNGLAQGNPDPAPGWDRNCQGFFLRANNGFVIEDNVFENIDDFVLNLTSGGQYGGAMGGNVFRNNEVRLKPGPSGSGYGQNRAYVISGGVVPTAWGDVTQNDVLFDPTKNPEAGFKQDKGGTRDLAQFKSWTGWSLTGETWGAAVDPDDAVIAELQRQLDAAHAENTTLAAENLDLHSALDEIHTISER